MGIKNILDLTYAQLEISHPSVEICKIVYPLAEKERRAPNSGGGLLELEEWLTCSRFIAHLLPTLAHSPSMARKNVNAGARPKIAPELCSKEFSLQEFVSK